MRFDPSTQHHFAVDQEDGGLVYTTDGLSYEELIPEKFLAMLPAGGGIVVGDGNCWGVQNEVSVSQFGWKTKDDRASFLAALAAKDYKAVTIPNKLANTLFQRYSLTQAEAVLALWLFTEKQVTEHESFDSGHEVRPPQYENNDNSYGERVPVVRDFLRVQNAGGYASPFAEDVIHIAFKALGKDDRPLLDFAKTIEKIGSPRRVMAIAVCVFDPFTGELRTHNGRAWGTGFIVHRIIGLNGMMTGRGVKAPGNPMRAALRVTGKRHGDKVNCEERSHFDKLVRHLIAAFRANRTVRPVK